MAKAKAKAEAESTSGKATAIKKRGKRSLRSQFVDALPFLHAFCRMTDQERSSVLEFLNEEGRDIFYQCIYNCIYNKAIPKVERAKISKRLGSHAKAYEYLAFDEGEPIKKRKLLKQVGAGLPIVVTTVLPILTSLLASVLSK
jgi:hypothetical protein